MSTRTKAPALPKSSRYEFQSPIGAGGVGTVYKALDRRTQELVAIKVLKFRLSENPALHQRLAREFKAATELEHPNIVRALACETDGELSYLVFELVEGGSLADRLEQFGRLPEDVAIRIVTQVAQALQYAHDRQVVHRDVKPDNILLLPSGKAKLTDFGLAKDYGDDQIDLTRNDTGLGTPNYMAPEQFANAKNVDSRCDVYSLGATLYHLVTGILPFDAPTVLATLTLKETCKYRPARTVVPAIGERTEYAIRMALQPDPAKRPATCLDFFKLLTDRRRVANDLSKTPAPVSSTRHASQNRRHTVRYPLRVGTCGIVDPSIHDDGGWVERWPLVIRDVSTQGIGVLLARRFEPGTVLTIEFGSGGKSAARIPARVVRVQPERAGHWIHGCALEHPLTNEQLRALVKMA
jgi:serine/threonine protein kinase